MKITLGMRLSNWWNERKFLVNVNTGEVHYLKNRHKNCGIDAMSKFNARFKTEKEALHLLASGKIHGHGYNGCRWCMEEFDNG